jgi:hypothetical protein
LHFSFRPELAIWLTFPRLQVIRQTLVLEASSTSGLPNVPFTYDLLRLRHREAIEGDAGAAQRTLHGLFARNDGLLILPHPKATADFTSG